MCLQSKMGNIVTKKQDTVQTQILELKNNLIILAERVDILTKNVADFNTAIQDLREQICRLEESSSTSEIEWD